MSSLMISVNDKFDEIFGKPVSEYQKSKKACFNGDSCSSGQSKQYQQGYSAEYELQEVISARSQEGESLWASQ